MFPEAHIGLASIFLGFWRLTMQYSTSHHPSTMGFFHPWSPFDKGLLMPSYRQLDASREDCTSLFLVPFPLNSRGWRHRPAQTSKLELSWYLHIWTLDLCLQKPVEFLYSCIMTFSLLTDRSVVTTSGDTSEGWAARFFPSVAPCTAKQEQYCALLEAHFRFPTLEEGSYTYLPAKVEIRNTEWSPLHDWRTCSKVRERKIPQADFLKLFLFSVAGAMTYPVLGSTLIQYVAGCFPF